MTGPFHLNDETLPLAIILHRLIVVDIHAPWCAPCSLMGPIVNHLSAMYQGRVAFATLDFERFAPVVAEYNVTWIPSLLLFHDGTLVDRIVHRPSGTLVATGPLGWAITPWEGNYYVSGGALATSGFQPSWRVGVCPYKGLYRWLDFRAPDGSESRDLGWRYVLPNPLIPFIWSRVGIPGRHPDLEITFGSCPESGEHRTLTRPRRGPRAEGEGRLMRSHRSAGPNRHAAAQRSALGVAATAAALALLGYMVLRAPGDTTPGPVQGGAAPAFTAVTLDSRPQRRTLDSYRGSPVVLNVWATWCDPCREEMPSLQRLYEARRDRGLRVVAVSVDDGDSAPLLREFVAEHRLTFDILHDATSAIMQDYHVFGVPQTFLIDGRGMLVGTRFVEDWSSPRNLRLVDSLLLAAPPGG